ncbi:protein mono-ADP-ribosyltransferase PARP12-like [Eleutherodactylus coqui]|uniref:protein mono-ADP-ribosyltransferase PARP12-like n=1 Tax=Eleutherodactylus coqui TaxID=57060 RepID=UPI003461ED12
MAATLPLYQVLCASGGAMEEGKLRRALRLSAQQVSRLLEAGEGREFVMRTQDGERLVVYKSALRLCTDANRLCGGTCGRIHICRFFMLGGCTRPRCKFSHSVDGETDQQVLRKHKLTGATMAELRCLLLQNDPQLLPDACLHYNRGDGPHGSCTFQTKCNKLHVCQHFLQGDCKFGSKCKRSHDLTAGETKQKLLKWGLAASLVPAILETYLNANAIKNAASAVESPQLQSLAIKDKPDTQKSADPQHINEICLYFILNNCSFKDGCVRDHYPLPYRWQLYIDGAWKDLVGMEDVEKVYCDPNSSHPVANFDTMMYKSHPLRRLSTPSSASKPPHFILTTDWIWYWKDEYRMWVEYGKETDAHSSSSTISSKDIENVFLSGTNTDIQFKAGRHSYVLSVKDMMQRNTKHNTKRMVCRRPRFVSAEEVNKRKVRNPSNASAKSTPQHWDKGQVPEVGYKLVGLSQSSEEYKKISAAFKRTLPDKRIHSIERVQNLALWEVYQWQKEQMKKYNGGKEVDERQLFHGTSNTFVDAICHQNFDWRICGSHGTSFGKGSYFARDAIYSHGYCSSDSQHYVMFVARVLVGDFTCGSSSYMRPPSKSPSAFYDSCVNTQSNPSVFVIFEKHQIYPEYVIRYTKPAMLASLR